MSGDHDHEQQWWRPVVSGLGALVAVSLVVGLVIGVVALGATRMLGGGGDGTTAAESERLVLPESERTDEDRAALHANPEPFVPGDDREAEEDAAQAEEDEARREAEEADETDEEDEKKDRRPISISASPTVVAPMERIDLTGVYQGAEGARVEVQRREGRSWQNFGGVTATVSGGTFATYVQTGRQGRNRFRVYDPAADVASAPVIITVG